MSRNVFDQNPDNKGRKLTRETAEKLADNVEATLAELPEGYHYELSKNGDGQDTVVVKKNKPAVNLKPQVLDTESIGFPVWGESRRPTASDRHRIQ